MRKTKLKKSGVRKTRPVIDEEGFYLCRYRRPHPAFGEWTFCAGYDSFQQLIEEGHNYGTVVWTNDLDALERYGHPQD